MDSPQKSRNVSPVFQGCGRASRRRRHRHVLGPFPVRFQDEANPCNGPKARPISSLGQRPRSLVVTSIGGLKARFIQDGSGFQPWPDLDEWFPGALPQAMMATRLWRSVPAAIEPVAARVNVRGKTSRRKRRGYALWLSLEHIVELGDGSRPVARSARPDVGATIISWAPSLVRRSLWRRRQAPEPNRSLVHWMAA